jgi:nicotinate phosphoribosyltransferase
LDTLSLSQEEKTYLSQLTFFDAAYVDYLTNFCYKPAEHVKVDFDPHTGDLELEVSGLWHETILYEVPLLALISESYFRFVDQDWSYDGQQDKATKKATRLLNAGCVFSEFGTRRRRDFKTHDIVMASLTQEYQVYQKDAEQRNDTATKGVFTGTSNVHLAMKYKATPIGTVGK